MKVSQKWRANRFLRALFPITLTLSLGETEAVAGLRNNSIDATFIVPGANVEFGKALFRNPARVFDDESVHIDDPKRAIRTGADLHRPKPIVGGGKKL